MKKAALISIAFVLFACDQQESAETSTEAEAIEEKVEQAIEETPEVSALDAILAAQPEEHQARYSYRHPKETLEFFGIEPGMTVVEVLPGDGWYSQILVPLLGTEGELIGADYDMELWPNFSWMNDEFLQGRIAWPTVWTEKAPGWGGDDTSKVFATTLSGIPETYNDKVDAVLYFRAMHNLNRFEEQGQFFSKALNSTMRVLKPGGVVGIVQHQAAEEKADEWASGATGYLKKSYLKSAMESAGFVFVGETAVNENPMDQPSDDEAVWRLPPTFFPPTEDEAELAKLNEIGESNRMTLLFKKPE